MADESTRRNKKLTQRAFFGPLPLPPPYAPPARVRTHVIVSEPPPFELHASPGVYSTLYSHCRQHRPLVFFGYYCRVLILLIIWEKGYAGLGRSGIYLIINI